jgi:hypothetical protein
MKKSYHVYASAKPGVAAEFESRMKEFSVSLPSLFKQHPATTGERMRENRSR